MLVELLAASLDRSSVGMMVDSKVVNLVAATAAHLAE